MSRVPWIALAAFAFAGCSLTQLDRSDCTENLQCQQGLGAAYVCQAGYCASSREVTCSLDFNCAELGSHFRCESGVCEPASDVLCTDPAPCVEEFGVGGFCSPSGFCADRAEKPERCEITYPTDLLDNPTAYIDYFVIGAIVIGDRDTRTARARAVELAVRVVNEATNADGTTGLPGGVQVGLVACTSQQDDAIDARTSSSAALDLANYLVNEVGAKVIIGPQTSANTLSVFEALQGSALLISPSATSVQLIDADNPLPTQQDPGLLWRTPVSDAHQAPRLAEIVSLCGHAEVGLVYNNDAYGAGLARLVSAGLPEGVSIIDGNPDDGEIGFPYTTISGQVTAQNRMAENLDVDIAIFIDSLPEANLRFLSAMQDNSGWGDRPILLPDAGATADAVSGIASETFVTSVRGTRPSSSRGPVFAGFQDTFEGFFGSIDPVSNSAIQNDTVAFVAQAYDATWLAMYGTAWAMLNEVDVSPKTIARGLRKLTDGPVGYNVGAADWGLVLFDFLGRNAVDLQGASSQLDFDPLTEELRFSEDEKVIEIYRYVPDGSGGYNVTAQEEPAEPVCPFGG